LKSKLTAIWKDPDLAVKKRDFHCVHVMGISTPRWTADGEEFGAKAHMVTE